MTVRMTLSVLSISLAFAAMAASQATAQSLKPPYVSYAAKFSCGSAKADSDVVEGNYATAINIHNPQSTIAVTFRKKFVLANQEGQPAGLIFTVQSETLKPDIAERVDCAVIAKNLDLSLAANHSDGFVIIEVSPIPGAAGPTFQPALDVVGIYSSRGVGTAVASSSVDVVVYQGTLITK
jgi:hypothetical protein